MEVSHGAVALAGLVIGLWLQGRSSEPEVARPCSCHCACAVPDKASGDSHWLWLGVLIILLLLGANLALVCRVSFKKHDSGAQEFTFSLKGKPGKGLYGAGKGLQILDQ